MRLTLPSLLTSLLIILPTQGFSAKKTADPHPATQPAATSKANDLTLAYLGQASATPAIRPFFDPPIHDEGMAGAQLGITDDNTTGQFTQQHFVLKTTWLTAEADAVAAYKALLAEGHQHILLDLPAALIRQLANLPESAPVLLYDISSHDDTLRAEACKANVLHLMPSHAMLADALAQYLTQKRWKRWFLAVGSGENDLHYADAIRRSAKKFGAKIVTDKAWRYSSDDRRTPESEVPVFTQGDDYDVLIVADTEHTFGDYLPYRTWLPRPVTGTSGLSPAAWSKTHEMWGALQLQNRFHDQTGRWMTDKDYAGWLAVRAVGEAATRARSIVFDAIRTTLLDPGFSLAGFKGVPLSFRSWDHQLRQPVLLTTERSPTATAPIEGYLHPVNELDTLGIDAAESHCTF